MPSSRTGSSRPPTPFDARETPLEAFPGQADPTPIGLPAEFPPPAFPTLPGHEILRELGRGGMGIVYLARQLGLNRLVALKVIRDDVRVSPEAVARFRAEAEAVARLCHPHIVQVFQIGDQPNGLPFFSLEFVEGGSLDRRLRGQPLAPADAAALTATLAEAMAYAHAQQLVHRDLKPANVLLGIADCRLPIADLPEGSPPRGQAAGQSAIGNLQSAIPKIADFGLVKRLDLAAGPTRVGQVLGTPCYMAPEQARGNNEKIGPAADVYALGAILYECLTGRPPFRGANAYETLYQVVSQEPVAPRQLRPELPRDIETICLKCLRKGADARYASATELADDLRRFLRGEPVRARPVSAAVRAARWARRRPAAAALLGATGAALLSTTGWLATAWRLAESRAQDSERAQQVEEGRARLAGRELLEERRRARDHTAAAAHFTEALRRQPRHYWSHYARACCHLARQQWAEARDGLTTCLALRDQLPWVRLLRAHALTELGRTAATPGEAAARHHEAEEDLLRAGAEQLDERERYHLLVTRGLLQYRRGRPTEAEADLRAAQALWPAAAFAHLNLAEIYREQGRFIEALAELDRAVERAPDLALPYRRRGRVHAALGRDPAAASRDLAAAATREPDPTTAALDHLELARLAAERGDPAAAEAACVDALRRLPAEAALATSSPEEAARLRTCRVRAHRERAQAFQSARRDTEAVTELRVVLQLTRAATVEPPFLAEVYATLARSLARLHLEREAWASYATALALADERLAEGIRREPEYRAVVGAGRDAR